MDEPKNNPKLFLEVNFLNYIFNVVINHITERFEQLKEHIDTFLF